MNLFNESFVKNIDKKYLNWFKKEPKKISKPLVVFGDPYYGLGSRFYNMFMDGYGCGDETVDLIGAHLNVL